jgi:hypothetical protein
MMGLFKGFDATVKDVAIALAPFIITFVFFQIFMLKLPKRQVKKIIKGLILTFVGLSLFLHGVHVGFSPMAEQLGMAIGGTSYNWILIPIGLLLGFAVILAEPTVKVLVDQVETASGGHINRKILLYTLCIGVAVSVAAAIIRVLTGISLWYFLVPGYIICLVLTRFIPSDFVAIAFDSGAAATGPMTVTFILSLVVGVAKQLEGRDPLLDGFGVVSFVFLAPILSILILGFLYSRKEKSNE